MYATSHQALRPLLFRAMMMCDLKALLLLAAVVVDIIISVLLWYFRSGSGATNELANTNINQPNVSDAVNNSQVESTNQNVTNKCNLQNEQNFQAILDRTANTFQ